MEFYGRRDMKTIKMVLGNRIIAEVNDGELHDLLNNRHPFALKPQELYDASFYGIPHSSTFDDRVKLVQAGQYFCYVKPSLKMIVVEQ